MADEIAKTVPTAGPNQDQTPASNAGYPEPVILEERIIAPAPKKEAPLPTAAPLAAPAPTTVKAPPVAPTPIAPVLPKISVPPAMSKPADEAAPIPKIITPPTSFKAAPAPPEPSTEKNPAEIMETPLKPESTPGVVTPTISDQVGLWKPQPGTPAPAAPAQKPLIPPVMNVMPKTPPTTPIETRAEPHEAPPVPATFATLEESAKPVLTHIAPAAEPDAPRMPPPAVPPKPHPEAPMPVAQVAQPTPAASAKVVAKQDELRDNIADILKGIKLPERREAHASGDQKPHVIENKPISIEPTPAQTPTPAMVTMPKEKKQGAEDEALTTVHTLKDDLQDVVREKKISLVRAAALEEDKHRGQEHLETEQRETLERRSHRTRGILFAAGLFVALGALALGGVLFVESQHSTAPAQAQAATILFSEQSVAFPISNQNPRDLKQLLAQARGASAGSLGSITRIVPVLLTSDQSGKQVQTPATLQQFFTALGIKAPEELMRAVGPDFFFGIHTVDKNAPLFVIPVSSYDHAFAGMLQWESTMNADLAPVFTQVPALSLGPDGLPVARTFTDGILQNYDVRELKDDQGNVQLYYSFPTPTLLIIAESPYSFTEILSRLQAERKL